jgi:pimeloyl-ACP methyl ester carboxylesterase
MDVDTGILIGEFRVWSKGAGAPLLLIHGFGASSETWSGIAEPLSLHFRVVTIDLMGFGKSSKPTGASYALEDQAKGVLRVISDLGLNDVTLVGHSMGGGVALLMALELLALQAAHVRLRRLVLIDSMAFPQRLPHFIALLRVPVVGPLLVRIIPPSWCVRYVLRQSYYDPSRIEHARIEAYADALRNHGGRHAIVATARALIPANFSDIIARYPEIRVPILLLWGLKDRIVPLRVLELLKVAFPAAYRAEIDDCGHLPHEEKPGETSERLLEFLAATEHPSARRPKAKPPGTPACASP